MKTKKLIIVLSVLISTLIIISIASCSKGEEKTNQPPTCEITSPSNGQEFTKGETITIAVNATDDDGSITEVRFLIDNVGKGSTTSFPFNYNWNTDNENLGNHTLKATSIDNSGESTSDEISIEITESGGNGCEGITTVNYGGQIYNTVEIGNQCWFKENLNVGTIINSSNNQTNNSTIEKYCYDDNEANCNEYGGLYQWDEMMQYTTQQGTQGICPNGWHIPTNDEWIVLRDYLGGWEVAGVKMKSSSGWYNNGNGTDSSGFTALPGGMLHDNGSFYYLTENVNFWSSTESSTIRAKIWGLNYEFGSLAKGSLIKTGGFAVRCVRD